MVGLAHFLFEAHSTKPIGEPNAHAGRTLAKLLESTYASIETAKEGIRELLQVGISHLGCCLRILVFLFAQQRRDDRLAAVTGQQRPSSVSLPRRTNPGVWRASC